LLLLLLLFMPGSPPPSDIGIVEEGKLAPRALKLSKGEGLAAPMMLLVLEGAAKLKASKPLLERVEEEEGEEEGEGEGLTGAMNPPKSSLLVAEEKEEEKPEEEKEEKVAALTSFPPAAAAGAVVPLPVPDPSKKSS